MAKHVNPQNHLSWTLSTLLLHGMGDDLPGIRRGRDRNSVKQPERPKLLEIMGPGLITGASDDDPSGIATYSQAGAQFGVNLGWTLILTFPLMCAIQQVSAQIGRVTGAGLSGNLRKNYPVWALYSMIGLLLVANTINLGADLGAMAAALKLLINGPTILYIAGFGTLTVLLEVFVRYSHYVSILKWLSFSLLAYVATLFAVHVDWATVGYHLFVPDISLKGSYLTVVVAVFGTTISPYLFFWQAGEEVEAEKENAAAQPLKQAPTQAPRELQRIRYDTWIGMALSNLIALCIMLTTAATLNTHGITNIQTSSQAAEALRPIAGALAFSIFAVGIIGTGMLALPVLAGSAAYALGEALHWPVGLAREPLKAKAFYGTIVGATLVGGVMNFTPLDPVKALFWSAVINGVVAVPIMFMTMRMATSKKVMGQFRVGGVLKLLGWAATVVMAIASVGMFATWGS
jgi:NRAMP (natural resistance-associated macrophage protein)-like metal ion transporter